MHLTTGTGVLLPDASIPNIDLSPFEGRRVTFTRDNYTLHIRDWKLSKIISTTKLIVMQCVISNVPKFGWLLGNMKLG